MVRNIKKKRPRTKRMSGEEKQYHSKVKVEFPALDDFQVALVAGDPNIRNDKRYLGKLSLLDWRRL